MSGLFLPVIGFSIVFIATVLGAALVFFVKKDVSEGKSAAFSGFASGIMVAASVFSLLLPSIDGFAYLGGWRFLPTAAVFLAGGLFFAATDIFVKRVIMRSAPLGGETDRPVRIFIAMTVHNLPEGLAVGFAFGSAALGNAEQTVAAFMLAVGIAVQNFPEGAAVSLPIKKALGSSKKAFLLGALSGVIEPIAALIGFLFSTSLYGMLPYVMAFAAGTMIFVVVEDMLPEAGASKHCAWGFMAGFALMMALDIAL